jgi:hypothetical protein
MIAPLFRPLPSVGAKGYPEHQALKALGRCLISLRVGDRRQDMGRGFLEKEDQDPGDDGNDNGLPQ